MEVGVDTGVVDRVISGERAFASARDVMGYECLFV